MLYRLALQHAIMELEHMQNEMNHREDNAEGTLSFTSTASTRGSHFYTIN